MPHVRPPAVAGGFYPGDPKRLRATVERLLVEADASCVGRVRALIVPHAGYRYSGPIAATGYATAVHSGRTPKRVALLGPSHFVGFRGVALPEADAFATPIGDLDIDEELASSVERIDQVFRSDPAHAAEHSLEVQLPFVRVAFGDVRILPMLCGDDDPLTATIAVDRLLDLDPEVVVVVSSDLSHYLPRDRAGVVDAATARSIVALRGADLLPGSACGRVSIAALLSVADRRGWTCRILDLRTSADTVGDPHRVVGYGSFVFTEGPDRVHL